MGKEIFYVANDGKLMAVAVQLGADLSLGNPHPLFLPKSSLLGFDVNPDGQRFLISSSTGHPAQTNLVLNWPSGLR